MKLVDYSKRHRQNVYNKEVKEKYFSRCYEVFVEVHCFYSSDEMEKRAKVEGISSSTIVKNAKLYMIEFLGMTEEECKKFIHEERIKLNPNYKIKESIWSNIFLNLIKIDDKDEIIKFLEESKISLDYLHLSAAGFVCTYFPDKKYLIDDLRRKINICREKVKKDRSKKKKEFVEAIVEEENRLKLEEYNRKYPEIKVYVEEYIDSNYLNKEFYCRENGLTIEDFDYYIEIVKVCDAGLYNKYLEKIHNNYNVLFSIRVDKVKKLIYYIENGVECKDGTVRNFDIIDYYQFMGINFNELYKIYSKADFSSKEWMVLKKFITNNDVRKNYSIINKIANTIQEVDCLKDSNGNLIPGTGRIIDIGEKEKIIHFLEEYGVPINQKNYSIAFRRYKNKTLFNDDNKNAVFVKVNKK